VHGRVQWLGSAKNSHTRLIWHRQYALLGQLVTAMLA